ncbi:MAG: phosphatidylcholine/phosphatidylserine synthase [Phycisphaerae bacterium]|nr:phosphatidylcholine/phosphatidylserine synthase [Phycisphaerae bacterium]
MVDDIGDAPRHVSLRRLVPNLITTAALCCGVASLHFAIKDDWPRALGAVCAAAILDALDGRAARLLRVSSPFGATLDSLADFVSFGIAPAFMLYHWKLGSFDAGGLLVAGLFTLCAALRLARFTAMAKKGKQVPWGQGYFMGMPTPGAAGIVLIPLLLDTSRKLNAWFPQFDVPVWLVAGHTLLVAVLMVSRIPHYSMKGRKISRRFVVPLMVFVGIVAVAATRDPLLTMAVLAGVYLLSVPVSVARAKRVATGPALSVAKKAG